MFVQESDIIQFETSREGGLPLLAVSSEERPLRPWRGSAYVPPVFNLQRFAAEDEGRTEDPTDRRQREEREKGNVPKSQDVVAAAVLIGTVVTLFFMAGYMYQNIAGVFRHYFSVDFGTLPDLNRAGVKNIMMALFLDTARVTWPVFAVAMLMGIIGGVSQVGALFTLQPLAFKPERLKPDFKRILPTRRVLYNLLKVLVQVFIIGGVSYLVIVDDFIPMLKGSSLGLKQAIGLFAWIAFKLLLIISVVLLIMSVPDYFYQRFEYIENLKMTTSEAKRERKDDEGDPLLKQRQRERGMELRNQRRMLEDVPGADVVVTNPTHYAVALSYDPDIGPAPVVSAKGVDNMAFVIRTIARENGVPVQENPYLARLLYKEVEVGQEIPENLFQTVSIIFSKLDRFRGAS